MIPRLLPSASLALAALLGCGGERWVIGEAADASSGAAVMADAALSLGCGSAETEGIALANTQVSLAEAQLGSWLATLDGIEAGAFPAARVQLTLAREGSSLRFAGGGPAPPQVDPAAGYLCTTSVESCASAAGFVANFDYHLVEPSWRGSTTSFGLFLDEPWDAWCRQQVPVERIQPGCDPRHDVERAYEEVRWTDGCAVRRGDVWDPMPCDRLATVERQVCACTAEGCRARTRLQLVHLRLTQPDRLEGALWFTADRAQVLLFSRDE